MGKGKKPIPAPVPFDCRIWIIVSWRCSTTLARRLTPGVRVRHRPARRLLWFRTSPGKPRAWTDRRQVAAAGISAKVQILATQESYK